MRQETIDLISGAAAGLVSDSVMHPIDTVRTRLWIQDSKGTTGYSYGSALSGFKEMIRKEGVLSLYKGLGVVALLTSLGSGVYFATYEFCKKLPSGVASTDPRIHSLAGLTANAVGGLIWTPMDIVKQRQQASIGEPFRSPLHGLLCIWREGGFKHGFMKGYWAGMATYGPFSAIYFTIYEHYSAVAARLLKSPRDDLGLLNHLVGGFIAGAVGAVATSPIDAIKTKLQVKEGGKRAGENFMSITMEFMRTEGIGALTRGIGARVLWIAPGSAIAIAFFELFQGEMTRNCK